MNIPNDPDLERALIGDMLALPDRMADATLMVEADDFWTPIHAAAWMVIAERYAAGDKTTVLDLGVELERQGHDHARKITLEWQAVGGGGWAQYAAGIIRHSAARRAINSATNTLSAIEDGTDPWQVIEAARAELESIGTSRSAKPDDLWDYDDFCNRSEEIGPWVIRGLLRRNHRVTFVGGEGAGKSLLLQQIAMCAAAGVHPFTRTEIEPVPTLHVDLENAVSRIKHGRDLIDRGLRGRRGAPLTIWSQPGGIDLRSRTDVSRLEARLADCRPALVVLGPLYKAGMNSRKQGETDEQVACGMQEVLDRLRIRYGFALVLEHHAPHGDSYHRKMRPRGSAAWMGWAEFGHGLESQEKHPGSLVVDRFRGDREPAAWPDRYDRGRQFPWDGYVENPAPEPEF